jgi:rubredoxin
LAYVLAYAIANGYALAWTLLELSTPADKTWMCVICGFVYDEAQGLPDEGIAPGTRWEDVPETWSCPDCGASKDDFDMVEF